MERLHKAKIWAEYLKWQEFIDAAEKNSAIDITAIEFDFNSDSRECDAKTIAMAATGDIRESLINAIKLHIESLAACAEQ